MAENTAKKMEISDDVAIEMIDVNKWYGDFHVLRDINLTVYRGERIVICGPSGSGKSTMIRCINRLEEHQAGKIVVDGVELTEDVKKIEEIIQGSGIILQPYWRKLYNHSVEAVKNHGMHQTFEIDLEKVWLDEG